MAQSILIDTSKCMGCRACQVACKQWNQLPADSTEFTGSYENPPRVSPLTWMRVTFQEKETDNGVKWYFGNQRCMHCTDAACEIVCPVGAIYHTDTGAVDIDFNKCIGCNYCAANCPFKVISFDRKTDLPTKCTFCYDRVSNGYKPACAAACPTGAIDFGERRDLINRASQRVMHLQNHGSQQATLYGLDEVGGTGMMYILEDTPSQYNLPLAPEVPLQARLWSMLFKPLRIFVVLAMGLGLWTNYNKSRELKDAAKKNKETNPSDYKG
ncbi:MAG: 4Fe-4S dicluster domain-containing protein [Tindallia sp. MSAO_Bac2]|nr:MAG: 4Fe-4S dicluster domain-containing protein [Tindallia sp. MSAO_Bac2]